MFVSISKFSFLFQNVTVQGISGTGALRIGAAFLVIIIYVLKI